MDDDQKSFIKDMLRSEGWKIFEKLNQESIVDLRKLATQQNVKLEDRLWYSALATGREQAIEVIKQTIE